MLALVFIFFIAGAVTPIGRVADEFGRELHRDPSWSIPRERTAAIALAGRKISTLSGNAWDNLSEDDRLAIVEGRPLEGSKSRDEARLQTLAPSIANEIDWLHDVITRGLPALRAEEFREELVHVAHRMPSFTVTPGLVHLNVEVFAHLVDRAATAIRIDDAGAARWWTLKALGVMTRLHLAMVSNDGKWVRNERLASTVVPSLKMFLPASYDRRTVARRLRALFWKEAIYAIRSPEWSRLRPEEWTTSEAAAERVTAFLFGLGPDPSATRCWQLLESVDHP